MSDIRLPRDPKSLRPPRVAPANRPETSGSAIVVGIAVVAALYLGREVLVPITLALLLAFVLSPLVELLRRLRLRRIPSVILAVLLALGIILALGTAIGSQVANLAKGIPLYQATIETKIANLRENTIDRISREIGSLGHRLTGAGSGSGEKNASTPAPADTASGSSDQKPVPVVVTQPTPSALEIGKDVISPLLHPLATAGIIFVVTIFVLLQKEDLRDRAIRLFGSGDLEGSTAAIDDAGRRLSRYFLTQLGINTSFGVIVTVGLYFLGVPSPVLWGILGALLRFIPYIGSYIAAALPIVLAAAVEPGWTMAIWTAVLYVVVELTMGQAVEPMVYGSSTGISPIAVVVAAIFWTWIWGAVGLLISTPLTLCLVVLGRHVEKLEFLDVLLGDRPALSPVESFYQRMLASDPDEAEEQAERYLKDRPLSSYYDEVALKGLQLAASDVARGALSPMRIEEIKTSIDELVRDLDRYDDEPSPSQEEDATIAGPTLDEQKLPTEPPPEGDAPDRKWLAPEWQGETPVICIAGRGPLDEAASNMLVQLLEKHGLGARMVPHEAVSRSNINSLDVEDAAMVCISYLDISGNPAHLRYLLRRLRERLPGVPLLVGLWPEHDPVLTDRDRRRMVGADHYVITLREAVETCVSAAEQAAAPRRKVATATAVQEAD